MITIRRSNERGHAEHGWLDTHHTFSFADYYDPEHMGFGPLRVLNDDRVAAGRGFPPHGHQNMEIVSYVVDGTLVHRDSMGHESRIEAGELQLMSAGSGVEHSEYNGGDGTLRFLQIWVRPSRAGTTPRYEQRAFPLETRQGRLVPLVAPDGAENALTIGRDVNFLGGVFAEGERAVHTLDEGRGAWVQLVRGRARVGGEELAEGDGASLMDVERIDIEGIEDAELLLIDLPLTQGERK